jgi:arylsulfatase A-like enzyme
MRQPLRTLLLRYPEFVRTVDLAPTLAEIAGVKPGQKIDGVVLRRALK